MNTTKNFLVGVYDEGLKIIEILVDTLGQDQVLTFGTAPTNLAYLRAENIALQQFEQRRLENGKDLGPIGDLSITKDFFMRSCRHIVVSLGGVSGLLLSISGLHYLIDGIPETLTIIGVENLEPLVALGEPEERRAIAKLSAEGRLHTFKEFSLTEWLKACQIS